MSLQISIRGPVAVKVLRRLLTVLSVAVEFQEAEFRYDEILLNCEPKRHINKARMEAQEKAIPA